MTAFLIALTVRVERSFVVFRKIYSHATSTTKPHQTGCWGTWCIPCVYGQIMSLYNTGETGGDCGDCRSCCLLTTLCALKVGYVIPLLTCQTRKQIRARYRLPEEPCNDCLLHCCCLSCALIQEWRELMYRHSLLAPQRVIVQQRVVYAVPATADGEMIR
eukprot:c11618_g1_i2.p1 GENE.c11618_g1_i2~~c11618_g1_i2.p1  ORF type:complete len:160 (-),score=14.78 c11618_g1_i2:237-716(-)